MKAITSRLSAVLIVAAATAAACASSSSPPKSATPPDTKQKVAKAEARPSAPLPTTLLPGIGMSTSTPKHDPEEADEELSGPLPACSKDEDCWSRSCCPAKAPEDCVHASRARKCAIVDVTCKPSPMHYTCVCDGGACKGRLAPP